ncbi:MAG: tetratricopeptide repeat protein, partial [Candidatus Eisenbacteria bacterium]
MIGRAVDRFRIVARLGQGGMGSVWRAEDTLLGRPVALKLLAEELAGSEKARRRFLREARAASSLDHPCVATVYGSGEVGDLVYIALALVDGETVADCAARQPFELGQGVRLGLAVAETLGHAHGRGVIHRDVTGRNIMIDRDGRVFVLDFGLAFMTDLSRLTSHETNLGTAAYMAPEIALGHDADPRTDLYGLGVVLYEALTGTLPFRQERAEGLLYAAVHERPEAPAARREGLPGWIDRVILRLLEKRPEDRYPDSDALIVDLRRSASAVSGLRVSHALVGAGTTHQVAAPRANAVALLPFRDLSATNSDVVEPRAAQALTEAVRAALGKAVGLEVISLEPAGEGPDSPPGREQARRLGARLLLEGSTRGAGDRVRLSYSLVEVANGAQVAGDTVDGTADNLFNLEDRLVESLLAALRAESGLDRETRRAGRDPQAHQSFLDAIARLRRTDDERSVDAGLAMLETLRHEQGDSASVWAALGRAYVTKFQLRSERSWAIQAAEVCQRALDLDPHAPEVFVTLAELHGATGRHEEARGAFERALELRPEYAEAWSGLSLAYLKSNRFVEAEEACRRAIALRPQARPHRPGAAPRSRKGFRSCIRGVHADRLDEALGEYGRSLEIQPTPDAWTGLGTVLFYMGRYEDSAEAFERAIALRPLDPRMWGNLASACDCIPSREARAAEALDRAISLMLERLGSNPGSAEDWALLAGWRADRGDRTQASEAIERALTLAPEDTSVMAKVAAAHVLLGEEAAA